MLQQPFFVETVGNCQRLAVIGDGDVLVTDGPRGFGHFFDGIFAVAGGGVHLKVAANIFVADQLGQAVGFGGFDLAAIFAQLGRDVVELQLGVNFFFGVAGDAALAFYG